MRMSINAKQFKSGNLTLLYQDVSGDTPRVSLVLLNGRRLDELILSRIGSTLVDTHKYSPYKEHIVLDQNFEKLAFKVFDEIVNLQKVDPALAVGCADYFFGYACTLYWDLIKNRGSKNQARILLEKICLIVDKWEKRRKKRIHKGTPYFFLTFVYRQMGDIDSAFASAFKAIKEDQDSKDPILGSSAYKTSPAYKYASIVDDKDNYLYDAVAELRKMLKGYVTEFNKLVPHRFSIGQVDIKFFQGGARLEQLGHFFVYTLESIRKYLAQMQTLPDNDFYRMKNTRDIFNLCLITDKIIESKYIASFRNHVPKRDMYMSDGVVLLFEDKQWVTSLTPNQKKNPKKNLKISPRLPKDPKDLIDKLFLNPISFTCNNRAVNIEMRFVLLAYGLRNIGAHEIEKQDVFVSEYKKIIKWLIFSIFVAVSSL